ncbi:hypothetical protein Tco_1110161 [Tanacetum coccineum]|uniref:Uncharacterized protein n=1 Tax=Tanacetum coccineum TaxID=301880 RepID=A0ABQ5IK53_9ASTR
MSADSAVTYTSVHSEARSWSIPSEDPYEEAARQLLERVSYHVECRSRESLEFHSRHHDAQKDRAAVRAEIETEVHRHEWQRQAADNLAVQHIMRTQALEARSRVDTLEDTGSSS